MKKIKKQFAEWLAVPKKLRQPRTQKELADLLEVCPDTLSRWKKDPRVRGRAYDLARTRIETELPDIIQTIIDKAKDGSYQFVRLALELTEKYASKVTVETHNTSVGIEQYSDLIRMVEERKDEKKKE